MRWFDIQEITKHSLHYRFYKEEFKMKKKRITIEVTDKDLNDLEDFITTVNICEVHNREYHENQSDVEKLKIQNNYYNCKACERIQKHLRKTAWKINCNLFDQYYKGESK